MKSVLFAFTVLLLSSACGDSASGTGSEDGKTDGDCCPRDVELSGCMRLGGSGTCGETCDFWCSENWRVEDDSQGCEKWVYDVRAPRSGENVSCMREPGRDAGN